MRKLVQTPKFAYLVGYFIADGGLYKDSSGFRFEFYDGSSIEDELRHSYNFLYNIGLLFKELVGSNINIRRRTNMYVLNFRNKKLAKCFVNTFNFKPGKKAHIVDIPRIYKSTELEKYFWLGVMDGDGMIARNRRKIAIESVSKALINSFSNFLSKNSIKHVLTYRKINKTKAYGIRLSSAFFPKYVETLGFSHPRKRKWLENHLGKKEFYAQSKVQFNNYLLHNKILDYSKIFETDRVFIVNGKCILKKYGLKHEGRANKPFTKVFSALRSTGLSKIEILELLSQYKWKMSKGSTSQVRLPFAISDELLKISSLVRVYDNSIRISKKYTKSMQLDYNEAISTIEDLFEIKPHFSCKNEVIFSSRVLELLFSKVIKRIDDQVSLPRWHKELQI